MTKLNDYINEMLRLAGSPLMEEGEPLALQKGATKIAKPSQSKGWEEIKTSDMEKESVPASKTGLPEFKYGEGGSLVKASSNKDSAGSSEPKELKGAEVKPCKDGKCSSKGKQSSGVKPHGEMSKAEHEKFHKEHPEHKDPKGTSDDKKKVNESALNEGLLGSDDSAIMHPIKAVKNFKKGLNKISNYADLLTSRDSFDKSMEDYFQSVVEKIRPSNGKYPEFRHGWDENGLYIESIYVDMPPSKDFGYKDTTMNVGFDNIKYGKKLYLPKLTKFIEKYHSLPSENQLKDYLEKVISNRFDKNFENKKSRLQNNVNKHLPDEDDARFTESAFSDVKKKFKDAMPKAGAFRDDEDKIEGVFFGNGSDEYLDAAKEMAYKLRDQGKNIGYISQKDIDDYIANGRKLPGEEDELEDDSYDFEDEYDEAYDPDDTEQYETCVWCGEKFPKSDLKKDRDLGYVCNHCSKGLESREGPLNYEKD